MRVMVVVVVRWCMGGAGGYVGLWEGLCGGGAGGGGAAPPGGGAGEGGGRGGVGGRVCAPRGGGRPPTNAMGMSATRVG